MNEKLEIAIILLSDNGREINFRDIKSGSSYLEERELTPDFFWGACGGFEIITEGYKIIYRASSFMLC